MDMRKAAGEALTQSAHDFIASQRSTYPYLTREAFYGALRAAIRTYPEARCWRVQGGLRIPSGKSVLDCVSLWSSWYNTTVNHGDQGTLAFNSERGSGSIEYDCRSRPYPTVRFEVQYKPSWGCFRVPESVVITCEYTWDTLPTESLPDPAGGAGRA